MPVAVEPALPPAQEQPQREHDDHDADERLRSTLRRVGQVAAEEDDRKPEDEQRRRVPEPPGEPEDRRPARRPDALACDDRRDRDEMVRVGGVAQAEQERDGEDYERPPAAERGDCLVEPEHAASLRGRDDAASSTPAATMTGRTWPSRRSQGDRLLRS